MRCERCGTGDAALFVLWTTRDFRCKACISEDEWTHNAVSMIVAAPQKPETDWHRAYRELVEAMRCCRRCGAPAVGFHEGYDACEQHRKNYSERDERLNEVLKKYGDGR